MIPDKKILMITVMVRVMMVMFLAVSKKIENIEDYFAIAFTDHQKMTSNNLK